MVAGDLGAGDPIEHIAEIVWQELGIQDVAAFEAPR